MIPAWLDEATQALVRDLIATLIARHKEQIVAILLYGSVARHDERPLDDPYPSDVDMLVIFRTADRHAPFDWHIDATLGDAYRRHLDAPREVNLMFGTQTLDEWDPTYIENVLRDGIVLYGAVPPSVIVKAYN